MNKIDKSLPDSSRKIGRRLKSTQTEKRNVTADNTERERIIRDNQKQLHDNKMDNLEQMDRFLEKYNLLKLNQEEMENVNKSSTNTSHKF